MNKEIKYEKGKHYEDLGKYLGIIKVYPHGEDYILKNHKFAEETNSNDRVSCAKINEILIEKIKRSDS